MQHFIVPGLQPTLSLLPSDNPFPGFSPSLSVTTQGTAPQRCSCRAGWGSHGTSLCCSCCPFPVSSSLLTTSLALDLFREIERKICRTLWCPCARGGLGVGAGTARPGGRAVQGAQPRVRVRMKVRTHLKAVGKEDGFGEAASPSAGKSKQRQQSSRWPRRTLQEEKGKLMCKERK